MRPAGAEPSATAACPWVGADTSPDERADDVVAQMTTLEKATMLSLHYGPSGYENTVGPIPRLCVPMLVLQDGPAGVGGLPNATQLPAPIALAATFDPLLATSYGWVQGEESRGKGIDVVQGPMLNVARVPESGRVFEGYGEDPYLTTQIANADIAGIQSTGVMAMVKHFAANNQETNRGTVNELIDERTLHEVYLPPFRATLTGNGAAAAMCAYNQINGAYSCQAPVLLTDIAALGWGFPGFVRSDLGAVHDTAAAFNAGVDQYKPSNPQALVDLVDSGAVSTSRLDDAVHRVLRQMFAYGLFDRAPAGTATSVVTSPADAGVALTVARQSAVLLKNNAMLPLSGALRRIAVSGPGADAVPVTAGFGSSRVVAPYVVTPLTAIRKRAGIAVRVSYSASALSTAQISAAARAAAHSNVAVVFVGTADSEGRDRPSLSLPASQDRLVVAVARANPHTVVVVNSGGPVVMPWLRRVAAVIEAWYPGQESGTALAELLFGDVDFSGRLPLSFPWHTADTPVSSPSRWPGVDGVASYSERLQVGYRWYLHQRIPVMFPFGWGLSYTTFRVRGLTVTPAGGGGATVALTVTNTGLRAGTATPQVYVRLPGSAREPSRRLAAFTKVSLRPGRSRRVTMRLTPDAFSYWDVGTHAWVSAQGQSVVFAGTSARDLPLSQTYATPAS